MTIETKNEEITTVMPDLIRHPEKIKLDYPVKPGNDKKDNMEVSSQFTFFLKAFCLATTGKI
jgi:hypothetical protein